MTTPIKLLVLLLLSACASAAGGATVPGRACQTVYVENRGFEDAGVYVDGGRLGSVSGLGTRTLSMCRSLTSDLVFDIHKLGGGGYSVDYRGGSLSGGDEIQLVLMFFSNFSYAIPRED